uniref:gasdermin-C-like n=1 Tax=Myodes glareolus TaxID=447135 RepID=UPI0020218BA0|nr:gasdermin-C-like [Myodes glareolus]
MSDLFATFSNDVAKWLNVTKLRPVTHFGEANKFRQFAILQKVDHSWILKSDYIPVGYSLPQILEPNFPVPESEVSGRFSFEHAVFHRLKVTADVNANAIVEGSLSGTYKKDCEYDVKVNCISVPTPKLESLQNRKLLDKQPSFVKNCQMGEKKLYVVTDIYEVTEDIKLESKSHFGQSGKLSIPKAKMEEEYEKVIKTSFLIEKGTVVAYKKSRLIIENDTCGKFQTSEHLYEYNAEQCKIARLRVDKDRPATIRLYDGPKKKGLAGKMTNWLRSFRTSDKSDVLYSSRILIESYPGSHLACLLSLGKIEEPYHQDFKRLQNEVSQKTEKLAMLPKDVQEDVFSSLLLMLSKRQILYDLMIMLELDQLGHMDGPGDVILDQLRQDSIPSWIDFRNLILYLLQALMVLSDTQLKLLAQSMEKRLLLHQRELVKSILQPNFKYPWNIPFTLQPQLLAPLQGEGLVITYELLKECGLEMELNNPRSTWDLEAKLPLSALYGSLSFLQQLVEA